MYYTYTLSKCQNITTTKKKTMTAFNSISPSSKTPIELSTVPNRNLLFQQIWKTFKTSCSPIFFTLSNYEIKTYLQQFLQIPGSSNQRTVFILELAHSAAQSVNPRTHLTRFVYGVRGRLRMSVGGRLEIL